jgi:predicted RNA-binding Zn ribbon-like protein
VNEVDEVVVLRQLDELSQSEERADWMDRPVALDAEAAAAGEDGPPTQKKSGKSPSCSAAAPVRSFRSNTPYRYFANSLRKRRPLIQTSETLAEAEGVVVALKKKSGPAEM